MNDVDQTKRRGWLVPLLLVSLALNLLVAGVVVGWAISPISAYRSEMRTARGLVGEPFIRALPIEHRRALMQDALREATKIRQTRDDLRARFETFLVALRSETFDTQAVSEILRDQRKAALGRQDIGEMLLLQRLSAMSPGERLEYADALERLLRRQRR